ncbi:hypothetical protein PCANC_01697 [Puccinia coronata f. sp. avenae]|uniref:Uncharacterized protein n=1 Tax=Puccinia coronata f. sp. avenae TaxID=200324 RepID=A0A2N5VQR5_9BASI|nr:hypothetical protein PCANC_27689 [Puccinia coronata f. sp. avenae]PLW52324.1 hypothetical protein PCASD_00214 [Puccinia coronata f. sp. avenae]PLW56787.1 hypothetical protein PCANC_01697 [Puccinia coronata f. sp. avenae]
MGLGPNNPPCGETSSSQFGLGLVGGYVSPKLNATLPSQAWYIAGWVRVSARVTPASGFEQVRVTF